MVNNVFLFLLYVRTGYIDRVYQNCLQRIAEKDDSENSQQIGKKREFCDEEDEQDRPTKKAKIMSKHKSNTECILKLKDLSSATDIRQTADHVSSETNEDHIVTNNCHVTHEISDTEEDDGYYYYKGSWQYVLASECKKIKIKVLSFGLVKEREESVPGEKRIIKQNKAVKLLAGGSCTEMEEKKTAGLYKFKCKIDMNDSDTYHINEMFERIVLFKKAGQSFVFILRVNIKEKIVMDNSKCGKSCYSYFEKLENIGICYKTLQMMYILFMTKWLLVYDEYLDCWILKKELLPIHVYFSECYAYVMWKLKYLTVEIEETFQEIYKKLMLAELKYFCIICDLHEAIEKETENGNDYKQLIAYMYYIIEQLRNNISNYLQIFHSKTCTMSFYVAANNLANVTININKPTTKVSDIPSKRATKAKRKANVLPFQNSMIRGRINTKFYYKFHFGRYKKRLLFILAFTADFESIEKKEGGSIILTFIVKYVIEKTRLDTNFERYMSEKKPFLDSVDDIIEFFIMLKELKELDRYFLGDLEYYKKKRIKIWSDHNGLVRQLKASTYSLNAYREAILMSMGVNILDLIEDSTKDQESNEMEGQEEEEDEDEDEFIVVD